MKRLILQAVCILILSPISLYSQNKLKAKLSKPNKEPIPYASVILNGTSLGTISNGNGNFELALPVDKTSQQITISCIGYKSEQFSVDSLMKVQESGRIPIILLTEHSYQLQEVIVGKQEILKDAKLIFDKAIGELQNTIADQAHIGKFYFRQSHRDESSMKRLIEAAVSIYDPGITYNIEECKYNIDQLQSSLDNREIDFKRLLGFYQYIERKKDITEDSLLVNTESHTNPEVQQRLIRALDNNKASFSKFFTCTNMIRAAQKDKRRGSKKANPWFVNGGPFISKTFMKKHRFKLDSIMLYNGEPAYKIKILPNKKYTGMEGQEKKFMPIGIAYIRLKDYALFGLDYGHITNPNYKGFKAAGKRHGAFKGRYRYHYHFKIRFKKYKDKLYLNYLYSKRGDYNNRISGGWQYVIQEMANTEIINDPKIIEAQLNQLEWKGDHYEKLPYNKEFWDNYTIMLPTTKQENLKKNLQQEISKK
jgi:hypothetical protein